MQSPPLNPNSPEEDIDTVSNERMHEVELRMHDEDRQRQRHEGEHHALEGRAQRQDGPEEVGVEDRPDRADHQVQQHAHGPGCPWRLHAAATKVPSVSTMSKNGTPTQISSRATTSQAMAPAMPARTAFE